MTNMFEETILNTPVVNEIDSVADAMTDQEERLEKLKAQKKALMQELQDEMSEEELDAIQAEADLDEEEEKAQKKAEQKRKRLMAARNKFLKKVSHEYKAIVPAHTRTWRSKPTKKNSLGLLVSQEVYEQEVTVIVGHDQPNYPILTANESQDRGGRAKSCEEDSIGAIGADGVDKRIKMTPAELAKAKEKLQKSIDSITLWN